MLKITKEDLLKRIRMLRKKAGISQKIIADRLGLDQTTYSAMERGRQKIFVEYLITIADVIGVEVWELFADPQKAGLLDDEAKRFFEMWSRFNNNEKHVLMEMADQIIQKKDLELHDPDVDCNEDCDDKRGDEKKVQTG